MSVSIMSISQTLSSIFFMDDSLEDNSKYVFQIYRFNNSNKYIQLYGHEMLSDLHEKIQTELFPHTTATSSMSMIDRAERRVNELNGVKHINSNIIDLFVVNENDTNKLLSIPNNKIITIIEFIDFYSEYFPLVKPFIFSQKKRKIFKLYLMDTHTKMKLKTHDRGGGDVIPHPMVISL